MKSIFTLLAKKKPQPAAVATDEPTSAMEGEKKPKTRKPPVRGVFGRVRVKMDNRDWVFEQRKDGIYFKVLHGRRWNRIEFSVIYDLHIQQFPLPI